MCNILSYIELKHLLSVLLCTLYSVPYLGFWYFICGYLIFQVPCPVFDV